MLLVRVGGGERRISRLDPRESKLVISVKARNDTLEADLDSRSNRKGHCCRDRS